MATLGLGGASLNVHDFDTGVATVRRAIELGVRYFDTSPMYGEGRSQEILGHALEGVTEPHTLATKLGYLGSRGDHRSLSALRAQLDDNLRQLRRDHVDVLQVHEADLAHWWTDDPGDSNRIDPTGQYEFGQAPVMQVLREAKAKGLCQRIGITGNEAREMTRLLEELKIDSFLLAFNYDLVTRTATEAALPLAARKGVRVLLGGVLHCGRLAEPHPEWIDDPPSWMSPGLRERYRRLYALCEGCGLSLVELSLRYLLAERRVDVLLMGCSTPAEVERAVAAVARGPLSADLHDAVENLAGEEQESPMKI